MTSLREFFAQTDPLNPDSDGDGLKDGVETDTGVFASSANTGTSPRIKDSDDDGLGFFHRLTVNPGDSINGFDPFVWHYWAVVKDGGDKSIWVDGVKVAENEGAAPLNTDISSLFIGSAINGSQFLDGQLDDFAVFARVLSGEEINQLAAGTLPNELPEPAPPAAVDLIVQISSNAGEVTITWDAPGTKLQSTANVSDSASWTDVSEATSPHTKAVSEAQEYFRIVNP